MSIIAIPLILGCDSVEPDTKQPSSIGELRNIIIEQVDYDSLVIKFSSAVTLKSDDIINISFSENVQSTEDIVTVENYTPTYTEKDGGFSVQFQIPRKVTKELLYYQFTLGFYLTNETIIEIDTTYPMYKYPYSETEIFLDTGTKFHDLTFDVLKYVDRTDSRAYFRAYGPSGIGEYIWETDELKLLATSLGDYVVATDTAYIFYDLGHGGLGRYNLDSDITDIYIYLPNIFPFYDDPFVNGLNVINGTLYVRINETGYSGTAPMHLYSCDFSLQVLASVQIETAVYSANIRDNVLYYINWWSSPFKLGRYNMTSHEVMQPFRLPGDVTGITFYGNDLYFTEHAREFIGVVPFSALK